MGWSLSWFSFKPDKRFFLVDEKSATGGFIKSQEQCGALPLKIYTWAESPKADATHKPPAGECTQGGIEIYIGNKSYHDDEGNPSAEKPAHERLADELLRLFKVKLRALEKSMPGLKAQWLFDTNEPIINPQDPLILWKYRWGEARDVPIDGQFNRLRVKIEFDEKTPQAMQEKLGKVYDALMDVLKYKNRDQPNWQDSRQGSAGRGR